MTSAKDLKETFHIVIGGANNFDEL